MDQEKIGKFILKLRKEKNMTQIQLAERLGVTDRAISKWENGRGMPDLSLMKPLCDELGITINELLSGKKIEEKDYYIKSEENILNTIIYSEKKIKRNRIKNICFTIMLVFAFLFLFYFGYKIYLVNKYTLDKPNNIDEIVNGLNNQKTIKIYKKIIDEEYFTMSGFKIKNVFNDYVLQERNSKYEPYLLKKEIDGKTYSLGFDSNHYQIIDYFVNEAVFMSGGDNVLNKFNSADKKYFLLRNDINNDIDFYNYIANNYYIENNVFMDKRTLMENYSFNLFVSIAVPKINSMTIIKGDYSGFVFYLDNNAIQVSIIRDDKIYGFYTNDERFQNEEYLIDVLSTIEFKEE